MGYLFENMEHMDIQEERRKTREAREELEQFRKKAEEELKKNPGRTCQRPKRVGALQGSGEGEAPGPVKNIGPGYASRKAKLLLTPHTHT